MLEAVDPSQVDEPGVTDDWSFKDAVVHLIAWRQRFVDELVAALQGTPIVDQHWPFPIDPNEEGTPEGEAMNDQINAWFMESGHGRTWEQVRAQDTLQWVILETMFSLLPEALFNDPQAIPSLRGDTVAQVMTAEVVFGHFHEEHEASMRAWLADHARRS